MPVKRWCSLHSNVLFYCLLQKEDIWFLTASLEQKQKWHARFPPLRDGGTSHQVTTPLSLSKQIITVHLQTIGLLFVAVWATWECCNTAIFSFLPSRYLSIIFVWSFVVHTGSVPRMSRCFAATTNSFYSVPFNFSLDNNIWPFQDPMFCTDASYLQAGLPEWFNLGLCLFVCLFCLFPFFWWWILTPSPLSLFGIAYWFF